MHRTVVKYLYFENITKAVFFSKIYKFFANFGGLAPDIFTGNLLAGLGRKQLQHFQVFYCNCQSSQKILRSFN